LDAIVDRRAEDGVMPDCDAFAADLRLVAPYCRWMSGEWDFGMRWDEVQVVPGHIKALTDFLLTVYRHQTAVAPRRRPRIKPAERAA
jgi:hypothetical protein